MSHDSILRARAGITLETAVRRILRRFDAATPADLEAGARWYDAAGELATELTTLAPFDADLSVTREHAATVIAHLSPRTDWARNVSGAVALVTTGVAPGCIGDNVDRAYGGLVSGDPLGTLNGPKTQRFAANILGDREAVTVDVWALRVVGLDDTHVRRVGVYDAVEHAYRLAARRRGMDPSTMQASTWIVARNGRAS